VKVPLHVVMARRERLARLLAQHNYLPLQELCGRLRVSEATVRRDLAALEREKKVTRTFGGALTDFNQRFPSFHERRRKNWPAKQQLANAVGAFLRPGGTYFFDSGTTIYALAEAVAEAPIVPVDIVTSNLPAGELLAGTEGVRVFLVAGQLLVRQSILLGEAAHRSLKFWEFDAGFFSAESMNADGIFNSRPEVVEQQRAALARCRLGVFCMEREKLRRAAGEFLIGWEAVDALVTNASSRRLSEAGVTLRAGRCVQAEARAVKRFLNRRSEGDGELPVHFL
jgi:DeoR/GlpR family transcriptional regulator of sugar metabolism